MNYKPIDEDTKHFNKILDRAKASVFIGSNSAFYGSLLCSIETVWTRDMPTACTDYITLWLNPDWFIPLDPKVHKTILIHEIGHIARLHALRKGSRDMEIWNYACDTRINNDLEREGYSFTGVEDCWKDQDMDMNGIKAEEEIYEILMKNVKPKDGAWGDKNGTGDMEETTSEVKRKIVNVVARAIQQAKQSGKPGDIPGGIEEMFNEFVKPIIPWQSQLMRFFTEMLDEDYTWKRPNRRNQEIYLPSRFTDDGRLEHLMYFMDTSGSVTEDMIIRFNSEVKYIQEMLRPERLTLVQFDTEIQCVTEFIADDEFRAIKIIGRGGTSLQCVHNYILQKKPTAAIIFSDLDCRPMREIKDVPVVWVIINNPSIKPSFGQIIHIN